MIRWIIFPANGDMRAPDPGSEPAPDAIEGPAQALIGALDPQASQQIRLIPTCTDQNPCAHSRMPIEMIFHGRSISLFQASQQSATMSS